MRPRPTEVRLIRDLILKEEWLDEDELAAAILTQLDALRGKERKPYVLLVRHRAGPNGWLFAYGPYETSKQAEKACSQGVGQIESTIATHVLRLTTPQQAEEARKHADGE